MLSGIFQKRKKMQELRAPSLQDIKKFREVYGRHADKRQVETPSCFERSIYKAISCQKELHAIDFRQEDVTDPQIIALAETLIDMPMVSSLDLRDNRITDDGAKALLEVLRLQIIAAKTPPKTDPKTKKMLVPAPIPEFTRYITNVNLKGNEISAGLLQELAQYTELLKREDKRLEIRAALNQTDRNSGGGVEDEDFKAVVKLLTGTEPGKKEVKQLLSQSSVSGDTFQNSIALENVLLAKCSSSPSKKAACPPWEAIVQVRHANIGPSSFPSSPVMSRGSPDARQTRQFVSPANETTVEVKARGQEASAQIQVANPATITTPRLQGGISPSSVSSNIVTSRPPSPPAVTVVLAKPSIVVQIPPDPAVSSYPVDINGSPSKAKSEFRPPSSPPPPLPLPQTPTSQRRDSSSASSTPITPRSTNNSEEYEDSGPVRGTSKSPPEMASNSKPLAVERGALPVSSPVLARQDSSEARRQSGGSAAAQPNRVSPNARDDFSIEFDDLMSDEGEDQSQIGSPFKDDASSMIDGNETQNCHEIAHSVTSRQSTASSTSRQPSNVSSSANNSNRRAKDALSVASNFGDSSDLDGDFGASLDIHARRGQDDLSSLTYQDRSGQGSGLSNDLTTAASEYYPSIQNQTLVEESDKLEDEEERVDSVVIDIMKDGKPRSLAKLIHTDFKRGLVLQDFPGDVPFRNLVALILSENGLRDLNLFKECRFPCTVVLDLSRNVLTKVNDDELVCFPKLQVLDLSCNRLKTISGLGKLFDIKALNLSNNNLRNVINIEHLVRLQILRLRANAIMAVSALRLLSLNKMLSYLDLDDNPLVETDDRQRRKFTAHILNIIPTLSSIGSVPVVGHNSKDKKKLQSVDSPMGKSLLEHDEYPDLHSIWAANACDILQIVQDKEPEPSRSSAYDDDDMYGDLSGGGGNSPNRQKKVGREQQRQKDELRSKYVGYRSRGKAPPSPAKAKSSPFAFGPPLPPPPRQSPKKKAVHDPKLAQAQKRRSMLLSAPKYPPVDTDQLKQEQRRKSRPTFDVNMSVAERLQLVREKSLRRSSTLTPHSEMGMSHRHASVINSDLHIKRGNEQEPAMIMEIRSPGSPSRTSSPQKNQPVFEFRVEPFPATSPQHKAVAVAVAVAAPSNQQQSQFDSPAAKQLEPFHSPTVVSPSTLTDSVTDRKPSLKENSFLQSLAVSDFLNHAEEEISTALTALNVLLSMCERLPSDPKKLQDYRSSLDALDILDERESHDLFQRAKHHDDPAKVGDCRSAFEKLGTLKKCIKELLNKLDDNLPGSSLIRSYCNTLRTTELREILATCDDDDDPASSSDASTRKETERSQQLPLPAVEPLQLKTPASGSLLSTQPSPTIQSSSPTQSLHSRLFSSFSEDSADREALSNSELTTMPSAKTETAVVTPPKCDDEDDFDFLSSDTSMFDDDSGPSDPPCSFQEDPRAVVAEIKSTDELEGGEVTSVPDDFDATETVASKSPATSPVFNRTERSHSATSTDITQDIQQANDDDDDFDFDAELPLDEEVATSDPEPVEPEITTIEPTANDTTAFSVSEKEDSHQFQGEAEYDCNTSAPNELSEDEEDVKETIGQVEDNGFVDDSGFDDNDEGEISAQQAEVSPAKSSVAQELLEDEEVVDAEDEDVVDAEDEEVVDAEDEDDEEAEMFEDWEKGFDPSTNHYFWFNHSSGESQWVPPEGWPYEVDTPFEEDAEGGGEENAQDDGQGGAFDEEEVDDAPAPQEDAEKSIVQSSFEADDDDIFSDNDLPDF